MATGDFFDVTSTTPAMIRLSVTVNRDDKCRGATPGGAWLSDAVSSWMSSFAV